jgi:hypothetical protein
MYWHEFNRKLGGGSDFGAVIPNPTAYLDAVGEDTFYDVALATKATRTAGTVANDEFGISRAIAGPNQSWTSVTGDSFVYWNNSGWKLEKNNAAVTAAGINTANTVRAVLYYPAGTVTAAQQTYLENCFKSGRYPYAFRRSLLQACGVHAYYDGTFSGSNAYDVVGGLGTKTITGTITAVRAQQNKAFVPTGSQYIPLNLGSVDGLPGYWIGQWIKTTAGGILMNEFASNTNKYWTGLGYNITAGKARAKAYGSTSFTATSTTTVNDGKWHFCICEVVQSSYVRIWVDGRLEASTAIDAWSNSSATQAGYIFADRDGGSGLSGNADFMYGKGPMTSQKAQMLYFGTYRN